MGAYLAHSIGVPFLSCLDAISRRLVGKQGDERSVR